MDRTRVIDKLRSSPIFGPQARLGAWVAPNLCVVAEFCLEHRKPGSNRWVEEIPYEGYDDLAAKLKAVVKKRWLQGRVVAAALATPDMLCTSEFDPASPPQEQQLLPPAIDWDSIEYAAVTASTPIFCCMRSADIDRWHRIFTSAGLVPGPLVPSGPLWHTLFAQPQSTLRCALPHGELAWTPQGMYYSPAPPHTMAKPARPDCARFHRAPADAYAWCPAQALAAVEPLVMGAELNGLDLNPRSFVAASALRFETAVWRYIRYAVAAAGAAIAALLVLVALTGAANALMGLGGGARKERLAQIGQLKHANDQAEEQIQGYKRLLSRRTNTARTMHTLCALANDSLWFSELILAAGNESGAAVTGHALCEPAISRMLDSAAQHPEIGAASLEYSEHLSAAQVGKLTRWKRKADLYRFRLTIGGT